MIGWRNLCCRRKDAIAVAVAALDRGGAQICLVVDEDDRLLGTVTDGDIRRGLLRSVPLDAPVSEIMKTSPVVGRPGQSRQLLRHTMETQHVRQLPLVNDGGRVVDLVLLSELMAAHEGQSRNHTVVLMAGGTGSRLMPLTESVPKPLLKVGGTPILERIVLSFKEYGFRKFLISVNYKAEMIKSYFEDGARWDIDIGYLEENERLGTAGSLSLIRETGNLPLIVMNGDLLTAVNMDHLLDFHAEQGARATMCVRSYEFQVPYGVVRTSNMRIVAIDEKPHQRFFVNAGIYVLEPETLSHVPRNSHIDMPDLFQSLISSGYEAAVFPIREHWIDIGRMDDFERANRELSVSPDAAVESRAQ